MFYLGLFGIIKIQQPTCVCIYNYIYILYIYITLYRGVYIYNMYIIFLRNHCASVVRKRSPNMLLELLAMLRLSRLLYEHHGKMVWYPVHRIWHFSTPTSNGSSSFSEAWELRKRLINAGRPSCEGKPNYWVYHNCLLDSIVIPRWSFNAFQCFSTELHTVGLSMGLNPGFSLEFCIPYFDGCYQAELGVVLLQVVIPYLLPLRRVLFPLATKKHIMTRRCHYTVLYSLIWRFMTPAKWS